ncbi:zinc-binding dehydrogenase [Vibrio sp. SCSIO 43136]|uniref:zinc-binding dehydrogenase n=1 Tax=Vibrio sp. SCSIO 43136 TaxID=2819101 RepID=UPI0020757B25|nr:zinc-binding dehydrogenase [Vibrio sp. SCSIO 43136]USD67306.1 zinc-binding dehydrogenase [Vibrio sp. SCSIO 43136]
MKAITYQKSQDTFTVTQLDTPSIHKPYDVLVKVDAVGLNPVDAKVHLWNSMVDGFDDSFVGGLDVSGEIIALGSAVEGWSIGDKVLYHGNMTRTQGGFAEFAVQDARTLVAHPNVSPEVAAATPCAAWTAYRALVDKLAIEQRNSIFIAGGSGGVGSFAIQMAKHFGVETIITSCSERNHEFVKQLGATHILNYQSQDIEQEVMQITNGIGVDVALDCVGGDNDKLCAAVLSFEGEMVELVKTVEPASYHNAFLRGLTFHQLSLGSGHRNGEKGLQSLVNAGKQVSALLEQGVLTVPNLQIITLEQVGDALKDMRNQRTVGKIVAKLD